jgi:hypothetical protein
MKPIALLFALYLAAGIDVVTGLNLNLYGYGREPLFFSFCVVALASIFYRLQDVHLGMILLILCCAWLLFYPSKNGFDVVLSPTLTFSIALWLWQKIKRKK